MAPIVKRVAVSFAHAVAWLCAGYMVWAVYTNGRYSAAFESTTIGDSLKVVTDRPWRISAIEGHSDGDDGYRCVGDCWLRIWYDPPISLVGNGFSVDFDQNLKVIEKYAWVSP